MLPLSMKTRGPLGRVPGQLAYQEPAAFARLRSEAEGRLVLMCQLDEKEALLASGDPAFSTTPHYDGYGAILVDLERVARDQLEELIEEARRVRAPVRLRRAFDAD